MTLGYIIAVAYTPIMLRLLGQSEYGLYNYVSSIVSYLGLLSFGFGSAYMRYYSRYKVNNDEYNIAKLNGMFLIVFSIIGVVASIAGMVLVFNADYILGNKLTGNELETAKILMALMIFNLALSFPASVFNAHITANEQFIFQKSMQMVKVVANPFVVLPVLLMGYKSTGMVVMTTILNLSIELANIAFCLKKLQIKFSFRRFDFSLMKEIGIFPLIFFSIWLSIKLTGI
jgi:O-antigen/teichoic acid export membrane protein